MTATALFLVTISTITHAIWNYLGKRHSPSAAFFLTASFSVSILLLPVLVYYRAALPLVPSVVWVLLAFTAVSQAVYYIGLAGAYQYGQLSVAYPLARALPVLLIAVISNVFGLGKTIGAAGYLGIMIVVIGCLLVPMHSFRALRLDTYINPCCALALLAALGTTGYTLIDSEALKRLREVLPATGMTTIEVSILFMVMETMAIVLALSAYVITRKHERATAQNLLRSGWKQAALTGLMITGTYGLVLVAMAYVSNVSYIAAFRQLSIPLGALLGIVLQKEPAPPPKIAGIGMVLVGLAVLGLA